MAALARLILRSVWLVLLILGARRALEIAQSGADEMIDQIERGDDLGLSRTIARLHDALHRRQTHQSGGTDAFGEM